jgi:hypothetical protein
LTTRIECSRTDRARLPWSGIHGTFIEFHLPDLGSSPASAPAPSEAVTYFSLRHHTPLPDLSLREDAARLSLGRTPQAIHPRVDTGGILQDANYHDQIVKERNKPAAISTTTPAREISVNATGS